MDNKSVENNYESKLHAHSVLFQQVTKDAKDAKDAKLSRAEALFLLMIEPRPSDGVVVGKKVIFQSMDQQSVKLERLQAIKEPDCEKAYEDYTKKEAMFNLCREPINPVNQDFKNQSVYTGFE